ncbi:unnamed protein product [Ambrosiozyma monospora]|uniref:Unnamed protein product n=1 Tax=Ambrosiozyma monospora TaxID=43982 RepID=A0ACB5T9H0_AMBMO|nr:unnamed protein product [Ambrosiozyma monospora]
MSNYNYNNKVTSTLLTPSQRSNLQKALAEILPEFEYSNDLTSDVSILVFNPAETTDWITSQKYKYVASNRPDVKIVDYETILELYDKHRHHHHSQSKNKPQQQLSITQIPQSPIFINLKISLSRLSPPKITKLTSLIQSHGGNVSESLASNTTILITTTREGRRFEKAKEWGIPVVSPDWCFDCISRGAVLNTRYYELVKENGKGRRQDACDWEAVETWKNVEDKRKSLLRDKELSKKSKNRKRKHDGISHVEEGEEEEHQVPALTEFADYKKRRTELDVDQGDRNTDGIETADKDTDEVEMTVARWDKRGRLWNSVMRKAIVTSKLSQEFDDFWDDRQEQEHDDDDVGDGDDSADAILNEIRGSRTVTPMLLSSSTHENGVSGVTKEKVKFFQDLKFCLFDFSVPETRILSKAIQENGGTVEKFENDFGKIDYIVINNKLTELPEQLLSKHQNTLSRKIVTELFIERCLYYNKLCDFDGWARLLDVDGTKKCLRDNLISENKKEDSKIQVAITDFKGIELAHIEKLLKENGIIRLVSMKCLEKTVMFC